jgi:uncharacterized protein YqjF (DUF2071 family)
VHPALAHTSHRPWPLPDTPWKWRQTWHDLLFAHWPVPVSAVRRFVPQWLNVQEHSGTTWIGLLPFRMTGVTLRGVPSLPFFSAFPEMNLRLYVECDGKPGVWFISLDAARFAAVVTARRFAFLPYFHSRMVCASAGEDVRYSSTRRRDGVEFKGAYGPDGVVVTSSPGTLEHFLTERYCLYTQGPSGVPLRMNIHHLPWPLQHAHAALEVNRVAEPQGITLPDTAPLLHFSRRLEVIGWGFEPITV